MPSCVNIEKEGEIYTLNASHGRWPNDGFCRYLMTSDASEHDAYRVSADFYVPEVNGSSDVIYLGIFFNAEDEENFDFVSFR